MTKEKIIQEINKMGIVMTLEKKELKECSMPELEEIYHNRKEEIEGQIIQFLGEDIRDYGKEVGFCYECQSFDCGGEEKCERV